MLENLGWKLNMQYWSLFHGNSGYTHSPYCYFYMHFACLFDFVLIQHFMFRFLVHWHVYHFAYSCYITPWIMDPRIVGSGVVPGVRYWQRIGATACPKKLSGCLDPSWWHGESCHHKYRLKWILRRVKFKCKSDVIRWQVKHLLS